MTARNATPRSDVDVVVVAYNSAETIRGCVQPLTALCGVRVVVVDNASSDDGLRAIEDLPVERLPLDRNVGFAAGCNAGSRVGTAPYVLFLNPDARIDAGSLERLVRALEDEPAAGAAAPVIVDVDGRLQFSQRRFPRLRSTFAQALFLHHVFPESAWSDEVVRDAGSYRARGEPDWVSGACVLVRRSALERLGGWDETFFMYSEDADLCRRLRNGGQRVLFEPEAIVSHAGGRSAPRTALLPTLQWSRVLYARKHCGATAAALHRIGFALGAGLRVVVSRGGTSGRVAQARAFWLLCTGPRNRRERPPTGQPAGAS